MQMETDMRGNGKIIKQTGMANIGMQTEPNIKGNGRTICKMGKE